jgi:uncharacterized membrane protein YfcA
MDRRTLLTGIGGVTGLFSGLLGVGGGFVMVPAMVYLAKTPQREANGTSLAVIVPVAIVGALILGGGHQVDFALALPMAGGAVVGAVFGARLTRRITPEGLRRLFGLVSVVVATVMVIDALSQAIHLDLAPHSGFHPTGLAVWLLAVGIGAVSGVASGLLGIGGGAIMVPAMVIALGLSQHLAQGTSLAVIIPTAITGGFTHYRMGNVSLSTVGWLSVGGVLGAVVGAFAALVAPDQALRLLFGCYLGFTGVQMLRRRDVAA